MLIDTDDHRLGNRDRNTLREIALRLEGGAKHRPSAPPPTPLPAAYRAELDRVFGNQSAEEGDLEARGSNDGIQW